MARRNRDKEPVVRLSLLYHHPPLSFLVLARQAWFLTQGAARIVHPSEAASLTVPLFTSTSTSTSQSTSKSAHTSHTPTPTPPNLGPEAIHPAHDKSSSVLSRPALPFITLVVDGGFCHQPNGQKKVDRSDDCLPLTTRCHFDSSSPSPPVPSRTRLPSHLLHIFWSLLSRVSFRLAAYLCPCACARA